MVGFENVAKRDRTSSGNFSLWGLFDDWDDPRGSNAYCIECGPRRAASEYKKQNFITQWIASNNRNLMRLNERLQDSN